MQLASNSIELLPSLYRDPTCQLLTCLLIFFVAYFQVCYLLDGFLTTMFFFFFLSDNKKFMETVESIAESMGKTEEKEGNDATSAAGLLDKLSVGESNSKEEAPKEAASAAAAAEEKPKEETKAEEASSADKA